MSALPERGEAAAAGERIIHYLCAAAALIVVGIGYRWVGVGMLWGHVLSTGIRQAVAAALHARDGGGDG